MHLTFLGTGSALARRRLVNSLLVDGRVLVDPSPTSLWALHRAGGSPARLEAVLVSHIHADHAFGLPSLLVELKVLHRRVVPLVGPKGFGAWARRLMKIAYPDATFTLKVIEPGPGRWIRVGGSRIRSYPMRHTVPSQGYVIERGGVRLGYTGDTEPCAGLTALVENSDALVVEMTRSARRLEGHLCAADVARIAEGKPAWVTHLGEDRPRAPKGVRVARDLQRVRVARAK